jgi:hypothetical protein
VAFPAEAESRIGPLSLSEDKSNQVAHRALRRYPVAHEQIFTDLVAIASSVLGHDEVAAGGQLFHDALYRAFCNAYLSRQLTHAQIRFARDQQQYMCVIGEKYKSRWIGIECAGNSVHANAPLKLKQQCVKNTAYIDQRTDVDLKRKRTDNA